MSTHAGAARVMSPPPVYQIPQNPQNPQYPQNPQNPQYPQNPQEYAPQVNAYHGAEGPQVMPNQNPHFQNPNPQFQVNVHPQHAVYQGFQMQQMPPTQPQLRTNPIGTLNIGPGRVCCPACGVVGLTAISYQSGEATHLWAAVLCFLLCLGCIPYMVETWKDVVHRCSTCGAMLATWHKNGGIQVHMPG